MKLLAIALLCLLTGNSAEAATRSYFSPTTDGLRIAACLSDGTTCGKAVADQFCQKEGFAESVLFAREPAASVRMMDSGGLCEGETCQAFKRIKCYQPQEQASATGQKAAAASP